MGFWNADLRRAWRVIGLGSWAIGMAGGSAFASELSPASAQAGESGDRIQVRLEQAFPKGAAQVGIGSRITLEFPNRLRPRAGVFLGRMAHVNQSHDQLMFLDEQAARVVFTGHSQALLPRLRFQKLINPYAQVDGTCTGYALHHLLAQLSLSSDVGNGVLQKVLASEQGRTQFLVRAINDYYIAVQHRFSILGILRGYGAEFGLRCERRVFSTPAAAEDYLAKKTDQGTPVLISFLIGPDMVDSPYPLHSLVKGSKPLDPRLWLPRRIGQRDAGGHTIVAVSRFVARGRPGLVVLDSDWEEPRVWDLPEALGPRTRWQDVEFFSCE